MGDGPNDYGSSRLHLVKQAEDSLKRLQTDHIDIYHMHSFDATTPVKKPCARLMTW
jgi:aryl-alcohol dehydrogenase-like predicted oxidoreductase